MVMMTLADIRYDNNFLLILYHAITWTNTGYKLDL